MDSYFNHENTKFKKHDNYLKFFFFSYFYPFMWIVFFETTDEHRIMCYITTQPEFPNFKLKTRN